MASWNNMKSRIRATVRTTSRMNALLSESMLNKRKVLLNVNNTETNTSDNGMLIEKPKNNWDYFHTNFSMEQIYKLMETAIEERLIWDHCSRSYDSRRSLQLSANLAADIRNRVKKINHERHRIVCFVTVIEKQNQGVMVAMRHLMDEQLDNFASLVYERPSYFIIAVVYLIIGLTLVVFGAIMLRAIHVTKWVGLGVLVIGILTLLLVLIAFFGAIKEKKFVLFTFNAITTALLILKVGTFVAFIFAESMLKKLERELDLVKIKPMEANYGCCGIDSYKDYEAEKLKVPGVCCSQERELSCTTDEYLTRPGCRTLIISVESSLHTPKVLIIISAVIDLLAVTLSYMLICSL